MKKGQKASFLKNAKTLSLSKDTIRMLDDGNFSQAVGGMDGTGAQTGCKPIDTCRVN
jgi:hypothetical protein